jgi:hypothetical protein
MRAGIFFENLGEPGAIHRLGGEIGSAHREASIGVVHHGQHDHRDVAKLYIAPECSQHAPTVHAGHHVQGDGHRLQFARQAQPCRAPLAVRSVKPSLVRNRRIKSRCVGSSSTTTRTIDCAKAPPNVERPRGRQPTCPQGSLPFSLNSAMGEFSLSGLRPGWWKD